MPYYREKKNKTFESKLKKPVQATNNVSPFPVSINNYPRASSFVNNCLYNLYAYTYST